MTLSLEGAAAEAPDAPALRSAGRVISYAELRSAAERSLPPNDPLPLVAASTVEVALEIHAALEQRRTLVLLHPRLPAAERAQLVASLPAFSPAPAVVVFTSGSEAAPKPVPLSRAALAFSAAASLVPLPLGPADRWLLPLPLAHVGGLSVLTRCLWARQCAVLPSSAGLLEDLRRERVTVVSLVPTLLGRLLAEPSFPPPDLRVVLLGGAPAPAKLLAAARARIPVLETYGLSEAASQVATQRLGWDDSGVGPPLPGTEIAIREGEILIRGPTLMDGGPRSPDGFFPTGDLGALDPAGNLHVLGRKKALIISGGENVSPRAVERALEAMPGVEAALVFGQPDPEWGERVVAALVGDCDLAQLEARCRAELAPFQRPRRWYRLAAFPLLPNGKIDAQAVIATCVPNND